MTSTYSLSTRPKSAMLSRLPKPTSWPRKSEAAAEVDHRRLEAHAGPQRLLLEEQGHHAAGQQRLAKAAVELGFQVSVMEKMRSISAVVRSANVSRCRMMIFLGLPPPGPE